MVLVQKRPFFQLVFFRQYRPGKCLLQYSRTRNDFLGSEKKKFEKSKNWHFCMVLIQKGHFSNFFSLANIGQENFFYHILQRKNDFLVFKKKNFKKLRSWHFSIRVNPWIWSKNANFSNFFFLGNLGKETVFYYILEQKKGLSKL